MLFGNENNPAVLKCLLALHSVGKEINFKIVNLNDERLPPPRHLPYLQIGVNNFIFSPNAIVFYFLPDESISINEWLEWEATILIPAIAQFISSNTTKADLLISSLKILDDNLKDKTYLAKATISSCDIAIWSTLYPMYADEKLLQRYLIQYQNVCNWFKTILELKETKTTLESYPVSPGNSSYQVLFKSTKFLLGMTPNCDLNVQQPQSPSDIITEQELSYVKDAWNKRFDDIKKLKRQPKVVLPVSGEGNVLVTSALPYVNNVPHLGNIIGCVLSSDVYARYCRLCNYNTIFIGGTDEYGTATETKALEEGTSCQALCDKYYKIHKDIYEWFNISFDHFGRTSTPHQTELCHRIFNQLNKNGFTFTKCVEQLHCERCDRYLADRFVEGGCPHPGCNYEDARGDQCDNCGKLVNATELINPRCKVCKNSPKIKTSEQFFLDLPKLEPLLLCWLKKRDINWSHNAQVITRTWLKEGLKARCITRDLKWGVPVPLDGYRNKVFYVWFDAPIGYMSITKAYTDDWEKWWRPDRGVNITLNQFMAKDNIPFHSVMFPATLLGANDQYLIVSNIMATEYLNYEDGKFSKSRGIGVFGNSARDTGIPSDVWRFYLLYIRPESQDSSFSWIDLATKNNSELLNNLGNFINRALMFAKNNLNQTIPEMELNKDDYMLLALCTKELKNYITSLETGKLRDGIRHILSISRHGNQYIQSNQPWVLLKGSEEERTRAGSVIGISCNIACLLAILLHPYMPETSANLKKQLNITDIALCAENPQINNYLRAGHKLGEPYPLFTKLDTDKIEELRNIFGGKQNGDHSVGEPQNELNKNFKSQPKEQLHSNCVSEQELEEQIAQQGFVVRKLKESGAEKTIWQPEVKKLLKLKTELSSLKGIPIEKPQSKSKSKKEKK